MDKIKIMLADDHNLMRATMRRALEHFPDIEVIGEAVDGEQTIEILRKLKPDILLCDIRMPVLSGIEVARQAKEVSPETRILVVSAYDDDDYVIELFRAGVSGYLLKTVDLEQLVESIRIIHNGQTVFDPRISAKLTALVAQSGSRAGRLDSLSRRELEILRFAAKGMTNKATAAKIGLSVRTVEGHMARIIDKLGVPSRASAIEYFSKS